MTHSRGFTYLGLLLGVALFGLGLAAVGQVWSTTVKREREQELLFVGEQFRQAIGQYYESSPGIKRYPRTLQDLVQDERTPAVRRHLRRIYLDPMTGTDRWALIMQGDQILGVHSLSKDTPLKTGNFAALTGTFAEATADADWRFVYAPAGTTGAAAAALASDMKTSWVNVAGKPHPASEEVLEPQPDAAIGPAATDTAAASTGTREPSFAALVQQEAWVCDAARANALRDCNRMSGTQAVEACKARARSRYGGCIARGAPPADPLELR